MNDRRRIAIMGGFTEYQNKILIGVNKHFLQRNEWEVVEDKPSHRAEGTSTVTWETLHAFDGQGVLYVGTDGTTSDAEIKETLLKLTVPSVCAVPLLHEEYLVSSVVSDDWAAGRLQAEHLLEAGLREFGYFSYERGCNVMDLRLAGFRETVEAAGCRCRVHHEIAPVPDDELPAALKRVGEWLRTLPKPVGVGGCFDGFAGVLIQRCREAGIRVPDEVAVVGISDDPGVCLALNPALSSVDMNMEVCGLRAAELLDTLIDGEPAPEKPILISPRGVVKRRSSDVLAIEDPLVARAVRFIRGNAGRNLTVGDVLNELVVSQRSLELHFKNALGHTPSVEIRRSRIAKAKGLLAQTDLSMLSISEKCGFSHQSRFNAAFRRTTGQTPTQYRKNIRQG